MAEAYRIGVTLALENQVTGVLGIISRGFVQTEEKAIALQKSLAQIKAIGLSGAIMGGLGFMGLKAIEGAVDPAKEYVHQLEMAKIAGMSQLEIAEATKAAWQTTGTVMSSSVSDNIKVIGELRTVLGNTEEAVRFMPGMQKLGDVLQSMTGKKAEGLAYTTMTAIEQMGGTVDPRTGQIDPERAQRMIDLMTKASIATHGKVSPQEWSMFAKQASGVVKNMSPEDLIMNMAPIIQEMGGARAGTALTSMYQQIVGGVMPQRVVADWEKFGLIDMNKVSATRTGVRVGQGGIVGEDVFKANPLQWVESVLIPHLEKQGIKQEQISDEIMRLFSRQTSQREASIMATQLVRIHKDVAMAQSAMGTAPSYDELMESDPYMASKQAEAQWENLKVVFGLEVIPILIPALHKFGEAMHGLTTFFRNNPFLAKAIMGIAIAFTGLMFLGAAGAGIAGSIKMIGLAFKFLPEMSVATGTATGIKAIGQALATEALVGGTLIGTATGLLALVGALAAFMKLMQDHAYSQEGDIKAGLRGPGGRGSNPHQGYTWGAGGRRINAAPPAKDTPLQVNTTVNLDGKKIADSTATYWARDMNKPVSSTGMFDGNQSYVGPYMPSASQY